MKTWKVYRNGSQTLTQRITAALSRFSVHNSGQLPTVVVVNPRDITAAGEVLRALDLPGLAVIGNGGVALQEVWLENCKTDLQKSAVKSPDLPLSAQPGANGG